MKNNYLQQKHFMVFFKLHGVFYRIMHLGYVPCTTKAVRGEVLLGRFFDFLLTGLSDRCIIFNTEKI